jgi:outer membrane protein TolC
VLLLALLQQPSLAQPDTASLLRPELEEPPLEQPRYSLGAFFEDITRQHPAWQRTQLLERQADLQVRQARGAFDPKLSGSWREKDFRQKSYYENWEGQLKVPLLPGVDLKGTYEQNRGIFLNPESNVPSAGLFASGLSVPLNEIFLLDGRRNELRQAQQLPQMARAERRKQQNKFLLEALKAYTDWQAAFFRYRIARQGLSLAEFRLGAVKDRAEVGDLARIDTVEAGLEVQKRRKRLLDAQVDRRQARLALQNFWSPGNDSLAAGRAPEALAPPPTPPGNLDSAAVDTLVPQHPSLRKLSAKQEQLQLEQRYSVGQLLPDIDLQYNFLLHAAGEDNDLSQDYLVNNYKAGASVSFPIFFRKGRAKLNEVALKQRMNQLDQEQARRSVSTNVQQQLARLALLREQVLNQQQAVANARTLLEGERTKFRAGESTLFLVNRRERSWLQARRDLVKLQAKLQKARGELLEAAGLSPRGVIE